MPGGPGGDGGESPARKVEVLRRRGLDLEQRLLEALSELHAHDAELGSLQGARTLDLESIRAALPPGTQLLEYFEARGEIYACVVDAERLSVHAVADAERVRESQNLLHEGEARIPWERSLPPLLADDNPAKQNRSR